MRIRGTVTENLADVIQTLGLAHKTGVLIVQHDGPGEAYEQGSLLFQNGNVVDAVFGELRGLNAYRVLYLWTHCNFVFQPNATTLTTTSLSLPATGSLVSVPQKTETLKIPQRLPPYHVNLPDFGMLRLTRAHRQLFLLIDGNRPVVLLARMVGRDPSEVHALLMDLVNVGVIRL